MAHKRFLRDGILFGMIDNMQDLLDSISEDDPETGYRFHYVNSLLVTFKTCSVALERIEESIEYARHHDPTGEICSPLSEAAMHIQTGIMSLHDTMLMTLYPKQEEISLSDFS